jgi:hypothetical protein
MELDDPVENLNRHYGSPLREGSCVVHGPTVVSGDGKDRYSIRTSPKC